ncbi:2-hydroxyacid dehydrogenase [Paenibacillus beijingensis]|uniref:Bifunctional glyoxylate/hydroxypyruvate reductase B n=1 Tax=Paenibacillus beijingensis TaxID=1126833 RepID=A0A0D5NME0_9BACL|nr:D-glycerate dehydrogenase [Paenibacillus beijingensis]AJY76137.1 bifunctional glyoxylate/hydroxypyruvate reductase B [Paenibacillus beijingensis]
MRPKVYIAWPIPREVEAYLNEHCECRKWQGTAAIGYDQLKRELQDAEGLLMGEGTIDEAMLADAPFLRVISNMSSGYNHLDIEAMKARNVIGTNNPSISNDTVADLVMGLMLAAARNIPQLDRYVKAGGWRHGIGEEWFGVDVHHATLGLIGMGSIGQSIAKRAKLGFGMNVLYSSRSRKPEAEQELGAVFTPLDDLLRRSDFVVVMVPLTEETKGFIDERHFNLMKSSAVFINASRGMTVNEQALTEAMRAGKIRAAALDVFQHEPVDPANPLLLMDNVITLPHVGSATAKTRHEMAMSAARNLVIALKGEKPPNLIKEFQLGGASF